MHSLCVSLCRMDIQEHGDAAAEIKRLQLTECCKRKAMEDALKQQKSFCKHEH